MCFYSSPPQAIFFGFRARFLQIPLYFERFRTAKSLSETGSIFAGLANQGSITLDGPLVWPGIHQTGGPPNLGSTKPGVHQPRSQKNWGSTKPGVHLLFPEKPGVHGPLVYRWTGGPSATLFARDLGAPFRRFHPLGRYSFQRELGDLSEE